MLPVQFFRLRYHILLHTQEKEEEKTKKQTNWDILLCISSLSKGSKRVDSPKDRHGVLLLIFLVISYFVRDLYYCVCFTPYFIFSLYIYHLSRNDLLFFWYALIFSLFLSSIPSLSFVSFVLL